MSLDTNNNFFRSAPEVICDGHYKHASDVWAFGILAWELYSSYSTGRDGRHFAIPYHGRHENDEVSRKASVPFLGLFCC